jgi:hypothetical protein
MREISTIHSDTCESSLVFSNFDLENSRPTVGSHGYSVANPRLSRQRS